MWEEGVIEGMDVGKYGKNGVGRLGRESGVIVLGRVR